MWVKLSSEYLNLDHVTRVRFSTGWKNGKQEMSAELEAFVEGELTAVTRYRGYDADCLLAALQNEKLAELSERVTVPPAPDVANPFATSQSSCNTLHDI